MTRKEREKRNKNCFEEFLSSRAHEPEVDEEIWVAYCRKAGIEKTYWDRPTAGMLEEICRKECPFNGKDLIGEVSHD